MGPLSTTEGLLDLYASLTDRQRAVAAGFDGHIAKPYDAQDLVRTLAALARRSQQA